MITGYAATEPGGQLKKFEYDLGPLGDHQVDVKVENCGICHSDVSMLDNHWGMTTYPFVPGHEVVGTIAAVGSHVKNLAPGQRVGVGWLSGSCGICECCLTGHQNLCPSGIPTVLGPYGGFSERVRANAEWAIPIPAGLDPLSVGPLLCGGITVFSPMLEHDVKPTHRVGVIGVGGLGHMAIKFLRAWGCEVTAFSHSSDKEVEAKKLGAHNFVNSSDSAELAKWANSFDYIISTVNVPLDWTSYLVTLRPKGKLILVGLVLEPIQFGLFPMLVGEKVISSGAIGSPNNIAVMLNFAARHNILPMTEIFKFSQVNEAIQKLRDGKMRYRAVLVH
ncbi:MAG: NAD(P)-dependent alcohol dehydrogenase [Cyclobacteriaceae bacterium]|nr:NAD(P)-dependent alcohol dehydrogenase [Cyclobacteriaceae bacterium]